MPEDTTTTPEGEATPATPDSVVPPVTPESAKAPDVPDEFKWVLDPEQALDGVKKLKEKSESRLAEIQTLQQANQKLQAQINAATEAEMKEKEQYKELYELQTGKAQTLLIDNAILTQLTPFNFVSAEQVLKLIDRSKLKVDDSGMVSGVTEALQALADGNPNLIQQEKKQAPPQKPTNPAQETKALTVEELKNKPQSWYLNEENRKMAERVLKESK